MGTLGEGSPARGPAFPGASERSARAVADTGMRVAAKPRGAGGICQLEGLDGNLPGAAWPGGHPTLPLPGSGQILTSCREETEKQKATVKRHSHVRDSISDHSPTKQSDQGPKQTTEETLRSPGSKPEEPRVLCLEKTEAAMGTSVTL